MLVVLLCMICARNANYLLDHLHCCTYKKSAIFFGTPLLASCQVSVKCTIRGICEVLLRQSPGIFQTVTPLYTIIKSDNLQYNKVGCWDIGMSIFAFIVLFGFCWPWMIFLSKDRPLVIKIKQNWVACNNQMSKPISE